MSNLQNVTETQKANLQDLPAQVDISIESVPVGPSRVNGQENGNVGESGLQQKSVSSEMRAEDRALLLSTKKTIVLEVSKLLRLDLSSLTIFQKNESPVLARTRVDGLLKILGQPQSLAAFVTFMASLENMPSGDAFSINNFVLGLSAPTFQILTGDVPGREIYVKALNMKSLTYQSLQMIMHSASFSAFHELIHTEMPDTQQSLIDTGIFTLEQLWDFFNVDLVNVTAKEQARGCQTEDFKKGIILHRIDFRYEQFKMSQMTALHLMGAKFLHDIKILPDWEGVRDDIYKNCVPSKSAQGKSQLDSVKIFPVLSSCQLAVNTCQLLQS